MDYISVYEASKKWGISEQLKSPKTADLRPKSKVIICFLGMRIFCWRFYDAANLPGCN